jgi:preprotein translocase subunit SecF
MIEIFRAPQYDFIGKRKWAYIFSALLMLIGLSSLVVRGLRYDIDFTGGTLVQVQFERPPTTAQIRQALDRVGLGESVIQEFGSAREYIIRMRLRPGTSQEIGQRVERALAQDGGLGTPQLRRVEFVGPQVGRDLQWQAIQAVGYSLAGMLIYIAWSFKSLRGGVAAIVAVFHDVIVCLGALSLTGREFSLPVLAALLTVIGYSVNDTIVAYDRLRENRARLGQQKGLTFAQQMNTAINQTLSRTVLTALTTFFSTAILLVFGGKVLEDFAFALFVGVITGTYSTIYIAGALVVEWTHWVEGRLRRAKKVVAKA